MGELGQRDWSQGWRPDDDAVNGHPQGLLRMDNVNLDENGALTLVRGTNKVSTSLATAPFRVFSRILNGQKYRYVANADGTVKRSVNESTTFSNIITGGSANRAGFGVALGNVLITSGTSKKKDDGTVTDLGIAQPSAPTLAAENKSVTASVFNSQVALEGTTTTTDATTGRSKIKDVNSFGSFANIQNGNDEIAVGVTLADSSTAQSVRIEYFLAAAPGDASASEDYYYYEWKKTDSNNPFKLGAAQTTTLKVLAKDVIRVGGNFNLDWTNVETVILTIQSGVSETIAWVTKTDIHFAGELDGIYTYYTVSVNNNGIYNAKSIVSVRSNPITANNQNITVTHGAIPGDANELWIYRRKHTFGDSTDTWYRVAVRTSGTGFTDNVSDQEALNTGLRVNLNLAVLPNNIVDIVGNYGDRTLYLTSQKLYVSDSRNPDAIDNRATLDFSGEQSERNLWIRKSSANSVLVGTTEDIYEVQGTLELLADQTIDARIVPLGIGNPPIAYNAATVYDHQVIYMANDGWRITVGANAQSIVGHTRLLYEGLTRHGSEGIGIFAQGTAAYGCCVSGGKLFVLAPFKTTSAHIMYVYDLQKQYWYSYFAGPLCLFTEEDGVVLAGFGGAGDQFVRELEVGSGIDQTTGWVVTVQSPFLDAGMPSQRKDCYVLHIFADTGNVATNINYAVDGDDSSYTLLDTLTCNGPEHKTFEINSTAMNLAKTISLQLVGTLLTFKLYHWFITFEERPIPLNFLRLRPTNYGIPSKKKLRTVPFVIDTLGNVVTLTPRVDGSDKTTSALNSSEKRTLFHYFTDTNGDGIDYEYKLQSAGDTVFEFYGQPKPENVEVIPVGKKFDQIGPVHTEKLAKMVELRIRLIAGTTTVNYTLKASLDGTQTTEASGSFTTVVGVDSVYTVRLAKTVKGCIWHLELDDTVEFNRYWVKFRYALSGDETNLKQQYVE